MQLSTTAILARLLSPADFGLLGMATIVIGFLNVFKDLGTSAAVIQQKEASHAFVSSIFWVNVIFGSLGTILIFLCSPLVSRFYAEPRVTSLLRVLSITFFLSGIGILQKALLEKRLAFNELAKIEIISVLVGSLVGISAAILGFGVWSLVYQSIAMATITTALLWQYSDWKPAFTFSWYEIKQVSSYSLNLTGFNVFNYFARNSDYILIGKFLTADALGYYTLAYRLMLYPLQNISAVLGRVMFPVFAQVQDNNGRFRRAYLKLVSTIALVTFPMMTSLWVISKPFILTLFGVQWEPVVVLLMILAPVGMIQSIGTTVGTIYASKGRTDWMLYWGVGSGIFTTVAVAFGLQWGTVGVAIAYATATGIIAYPSFSIPFRLINLEFGSFISVLWKPFLASLCMLCISMLTRIMISLTSATDGLLLCILVITSAIVYLLVSWFINRTQVRELLATAGIN